MWLVLALVGPVFIVYLFRCNYRRKQFSLVDGRVFIEGQKTHRGIEVFIGSMETRGDMFSVDPILGRKKTVLLTHTNASGEFVIKGVPLGNYWLVARNPGYRTFMKPIMVDLHPRCPVGDMIMRK